MAEKPSAVVAVDRRKGSDRRKSSDRRKQNVPVAVERRQGERRKVQRRRQIDPTTCERDYTAEEIEFMVALDEYKRASGRMFPTCSEILEVLKKLGYEKRQEPSGEQADSSETAASEESSGVPTPPAETDQPVVVGSAASETLSSGQAEEPVCNS